MPNTIRNSGGGSRDELVLRLKPQQYVHISDNNHSTTYLAVGPLTVTLASHESLVCPVTPFHVVGPSRYCRVRNPVQFEADRVTPVRDRAGQVKHRYGEEEIRFSQPPFPLYPNEEIVGGILDLRILRADIALVIKVLVTHTVEVSESSTGVATKVTRHSGSRHLFRGPGLYIPRVEEEIEEERGATVLAPRTALRLQAVSRFVDSFNIVRYDGEEYLWTNSGAYICGVDEKILGVVTATELTQNSARHIEVLKSFIDTREFAHGKKREAGDVYLVTNAITNSFFLHPYEKIVCVSPRVTIPRNQYAIILDPFENNKQVLGGRRVVTNAQFFMQPGERLQAIKDAFVLSSDEGVVVKALEDFEDAEVHPTVQRRSGDQWLLVGPMTYIPNRHVVVCSDRYGNSKRSRITLKAGEGIYVREVLTGVVRSVVGPLSYMLQAYEELWEKELPALVGAKLNQQLRSHAAYMFKQEGDYTRDKTRVVVYHIPNQSVTQVYNYKTQCTRTVFGPARISLEPDEEFNVLSLSGSRWDPKDPSKCLPKEAGLINALYLFLGPSSMTVVVNVETRDHARLSLQLSYEWYFDVAIGDEEAAQCCFAVRDFVADACSFIGSRIRACVASLPFETFHKNSSGLLRAAVFDVDPRTGELEEVRFEVNRFVIKSVDVQHMEVLDAKTREGLQHSVEVAIEITTQAQESCSKQLATSREQEARGLLEMQTMSDEVEIEQYRRRLLEAEARSAAILQAGMSKSEAAAAAAASEIESRVSIDVSRLRVQAKLATELMKDTMYADKRELDVLAQQQWDTEEIIVKRQKNLLESTVFQEAVGAIGPSTLSEISKAGPALQAQLLGSLGLQGYLLTDGKRPVNLLGTAMGLTSAQAIPFPVSASAATP